MNQPFVKLTIKNQNFHTPQDVLDFVFDELIATLEDDAGNCEEEGDTSQAKALREKIADIEATRPYVSVFVPAYVQVVTP